MATKKSNSYNTESYALAKSMTASKKSICFFENEKEIFDDSKQGMVDLTKVNYRDFIQENLLNYVINAAENALTDIDLSKGNWINPETQKETPIIQTPNDNDGQWIFTFPYELALDLLTGGDKTQIKIVKDLIQRHLSAGINYKYLADPYTEGHGKITIPFEMEIDTFDRKITDAEARKLLNLKTVNKKAILNIFGSYKKTEILSMTFKIHNWLVQGMQSKEKKQTEAEKKVRFYSLPKNLYPNLIHAINKNLNLNGNLNPLSHAQADLFIKLYRYIIIHDTHINYSTQKESKEDIKTQEINLSLTQLLIYLKSDSTKTYGENIYILNRKGENTKLFIESSFYEFCRFIQTIATSLNYGFFGATFLPLKAELIEPDTIKISVIRPFKNKSFPKDCLKLIKQGLEGKLDELKEKAEK